MGVISKDYTVDYEYIRPSTMSDMDISTGIFTAPVAGTSSFQFNGVSNGVQTTITIVKNSNDYLASSYDGGTGTKRSFMTQTIVDLAVGDTCGFSTSAVCWEPKNST